MVCGSPTSLQSKVTVHAKPHCDDESTNLMALGNLLAREGFDLKAFTDANQALLALQNGLKTDLILLDICMPKLNGCEFYKRLQADPNLYRLPVIFLTGKNREEAMNECELKQMNLLTKPFDLDEALSLIAQLLDTPESQQTPNF